MEQGHTVAEKESGVFANSLTLKLKQNKYINENQNGMHIQNAGVELKHDPMWLTPC